MLRFLGALGSLELSCHDVEERGSEEARLMAPYADMMEVFGASGRVRDDDDTYRPSS